MPVPSTTTAHSNGRTDSPLPNVLPSWALTSVRRVPGARAPRGDEMPTKDGRVGFGVVGLNFGLGRCRAIQAVPEAELVAVASRTEQTAQRVGEELGVDAYADYRRLLDRDDVDVI